MRAHPDGDIDQLVDGASCLGRFGHDTDEYVVDVDAIGGCVVFQNVFVRSWRSP